jgi:hypothetical protein
VGDSAWAEHVLARAGFVQAMWRAAAPEVPLYRGVASAQRLEQRVDTLASATFSREIATSHFDSARARSAMLVRSRVPLDRLFMTFVKTAAMNRQFREAEAVAFGPLWR